MNQEKASAKGCQRLEKTTHQILRGFRFFMLKPLTTALLHLETKAAEEEEVFRERWDLCSAEGKDFNGQTN